MLRGVHVVYNYLMTLFAYCMQGLWMLTLKGFNMTCFCVLQFL